MSPFASHRTYPLRIIFIDSYPAIVCSTRRSLLPPPGRFLSKYFLTVRGETRMPRLSFSSSPIRSSPLSRINSRRFFGSRGWPLFRDLHLQNVRNEVRGHLRNVSGLTMTRASHQSKNLESKSMRARVAAFERRDLPLRSLKHSELFTKKQVLREDSGAGGKEQANEREQATS